MHLTENFTFGEMCRSAVAFRLKIKNKPAPGKEERMVVANLTNLCKQVLQPLRDHLGVAVKINSGYRSKELNRKVKGASTSQHLVGEAADIKVESKEQACKWAQWIMDNCRFDQLLLERKGTTVWLHVSCKRDDQANRQQFKKLEVRS